MKKKILVIGGGGREAAMIWALKNENTELYCAPGNAGIAQHAKCFPVRADDLSGLLTLAREIRPDLTVVGPEPPLVAGIVKMFCAYDLAIVGPTAEAARLEGSKVFAKQFMRKYDIPTADFEVFTDFNEASAYIKKQQRPLVIKADGLCGGKGVVVAESEGKALQAAEDMLVKKKFGAAGESIVIEERLLGQECSFIVLVDDTCGVKFPVATDFKRRYECDNGLNTGGMGCHSPVPGFNDSIDLLVSGMVIGPTMFGMRDEGVAYRGFLYVGLILTQYGPRVLEFNVRMGDPEAAVILPRLKSDFSELLFASVNHGLDGVELSIKEEAAVCVVMAAKSYPNGSSSGQPIFGIDQAEKSGALVFHAGTANGPDGDIVTAGGRILDVVGVGPNLAEARRNAYTGVGYIHFGDMDYRRDIAAKVV